MRPIFVPVAGTTDVNGNASIAVPLERTGDWRNVKIVLQNAGPAEWVVLKAGSEINFGRGRRVTLGPELLEPQDTITVSVIGGAPSTPVTGSASGVGGTMDEIIAYFTPAPNTISLDTLGRRAALVDPAFLALQTHGSYVINDTVDRTFNFPIPPGVQAFRFEMATNIAGIVAPNCQITGDITGTQYVSINNLNFPTTGFAEHATFRPLAADQTLLFRFHMTSAVSVRFELDAIFFTEDVGVEFVGTGVGIADNNPLVVRTSSSAAPAPWQAATLAKNFSVSPGATSFSQIVAGVGGKSIYLHYLRYAHLAVGVATNGDFADDSAANIVDFWAQNAGSAQGPYPLECHGIKLTQGDGFRCRNNGGAGANVIYGTVIYNLA